jgi:hypothetical protein
MKKMKCCDYCPWSFVKYILLASIWSAVVKRLTVDLDIKGSNQATTLHQEKSKYVKVIKNKLNIKKDYLQLKYLVTQLKCYTREH